MNLTKIAFPCSVRATRWHCCVAVAFWEVPRYGDVFRHSAEERPIRQDLFFSLEMVRLAMLFNILYGKIGNAFSTYC